MMRTLGFVINWPTKSRLWLTSLCIYLRGLFHDNFKVRLENVFICCSGKASLDYQRALMPHKLSLQRKKTDKIWLHIDYWKLKSIVVRVPFPYHILMRHSRLSIIASSSHLLIWHKGICRCLLMRQTFQKTVFRAGSSGYMSSLICHFGHPTLGPVSVTLWRCV